MRVLFFGTCEFAATHLRALLHLPKHSLHRIDVVTPPLQAHTEIPLLTVARQHGLETFEAPPDSLTTWSLPRSDYDLGVVVSFGYFIPARVIAAFKKGAINVHPSLLPQLRGASPIQHAILLGYQETGVSVIELHPKRFDAGRVLKQTRVRMPPDPSFKSLRRDLAQVGSRDLVSVVSNFDHYQKKAKEQPSYPDLEKAPIIQKHHAQIKWDQHSAIDLYRLHRALSHQHHLWTLIRSGRLQLTQIKSPWETDRELQLLDRRLMSSAVDVGSVLFNPITDTIFIRTRRRDVERGVEGNSDQTVHSLTLGEQWLGVKRVQFGKHEEMSASNFMSVHNQPRPFQLNLCKL